MAWVRRRKPSSPWTACWRDAAGKQHQETRRGWNKAEARKHAENEERRSARTPWLEASSQVPTLAEYARQTVKVRPTVAASTRSKERSMWKRIEAYFDGWPINAIGPSLVRDFVDTLVAGGLGPAYVRDIFGLLSMTFDYAVADEITPQTPCVRIDLPKRTTKVAAADQDDVRALFASIDPRYQTLVLFLAATGVRIGEALAVKVSDLVDIPQAQVQIRRSVTTNDEGRIVTGPPKTKSGARDIALPHWMRQSLNAHIDTYRLGPNDWLFPAPGGGLMDPRRFSGRFWRPACRTEEVEVTPHQLRHLHASMLIEAGRPITEIAARLGHANPQVTMQVYAHWLSGDDTASAEAVPDFTRQQLH